MSEDREMFLIFIRPLNRMEVAYMVTGSAASMAYGVPRVTLDIDMVIELTTTQAGLLPVAFPPATFYCPPREVIDIETERPSRGHFNVIHRETGFKADFYPVGDDPLHRWGMARRQCVEMFGETVMLAPPEYVIIRKLEYFKEGGSEKHLRDIRGMLDVSGESMDHAELEAMIRRRDLRTVWDKVQELRLS